MRLTLVSLVAATLAGVSAAQPITTPAGYNAVEGNAQFFFWGPNRRMQGIDGSNQNTFAVWTKLSFRRDGPPAANVTYGPRTFDYKVMMGPVSWGLIHNEFDKNYSAPPTTVYTYKPTNLPDWTNPPISPPAPFDMTAVFDVPYVHTGGVFAWDIEMMNSTSTGLVPMDRHYNQYASTTGAVVGTGCVATGRAAAFAQTAYLRNGGPATGNCGMHLRVACTNGPSSAPVLLSLDGTNSNLSLPFLCGALYAFPTVFIPIGGTDAAGLMRDVHVGFPHNRFLVGATFYTQLVAPDAGQPAPFLPLALSNARQTSMPADPTVASEPAAYIWSTLPTNYGTVFYGGCPIAELQ